jgi:hypothetical protein
MNLQQEVCLLIGRAKPWRRPRNMALYIVACALTIVLALLAEPNE